MEEYDERIIETIKLQYRPNWEVIVDNFDVEKYGKRLEELRTERKLTQEKLGREFDLTRQAINKIEKGKNKKIKYELFLKFKNYFGCSNSFMLGFFNFNDNNRFKEQNILELYKTEKSLVGRESYERKNIEQINLYLQKHPQDEGLIQPIIYMDEKEEKESEIRNSICKKILYAPNIDVELLSLLGACLDVPDYKCNDIKTVLKILLKNF